MSTYSKILLETTVHNYNDGVKSITGPSVPGDGYYNRSDGLHTVQWSIVNFIGRIKLQASLHRNPGNDDWFDVSFGSLLEFTIDTTGKVSQATINSVTYTQATTGSFVNNFVGNYVWIRVNISEWTAGSITSILLSH
jgi:hypothetical protein